MVSVMKAREEAYKLARKPLIPGVTNYDTYDSIYIASTSNVKGTLELYKDYDSVLTVGSTGAHAYEAALHGAKKVDQFDINELQRLFYEYMKTAIIHLNYEDFVKHFTLKRQAFIMPKSELKDLLSNELYYRIKPYLPEDVEMVFGELFEHTSNLDLIMSSLFRYEHALNINYLKSVISFYNEKEYYELQNILRNNKCQITYHTAALKEVPYKFNDKYDLIIPDNIMQYYKNIPGLNNPSRVNMFIDKTLSQMLTEKGVIQANYGFTLAAEALKKYLGIPASKDKMISSFAGQMQIALEVKEGIDTQLIKKWDHYSYTFIEAVEKNDRINTDNVVITYTPRKK